MSSLHRRAFLAGALTAGFWRPRVSAAAGGSLPFIHEQDEAVGHMHGEGLAGRYAYDHGSLDLDNPITPTDQFFVRTRFPRGLPPPDPWRIVTPNGGYDPDAIAARARDMGLHLMECSGNNRHRRYGLIGVARFHGLPVYELVPRPADGHLIRVSGFDDHEPGIDWSSPGASWIFRPQDLSRAFVATAMNGRPLSPDHGAPVRLVVPGWYGCCCIKWVDRIDFVGGDAAATMQMREFSSRTHQAGVPELARDYMPATIDPTAMAVRVEPIADGAFRVVGVQWGGQVERLAIAFGDDDFMPVETLHHGSGTAWSTWTHRWRPTAVGPTPIALRVEDPGRRTRRLDMGMYTRWVDVPRR